MIERWYDWNLNINQIGWAAQSFFWVPSPRADKKEKEHVESPNDEVHVSTDGYPTEPADESVHLAAQQQGIVMPFLLILSRHKNRIRSQRLVLVPQSLHAAGKIAHVSFEIELDGCGSLSLPLAVFVLALWRMNIAAVVPPTVACFQVCNCSISSVSISRVGHQSLIAKVASAGHKPSGLNGMKAGRCSNSGHVAETVFWCRANIGCALLSNFLQLRSHKPTELFFASVWVWF